MDLEILMQTGRNPFGYAQGEFCALMEFAGLGRIGRQEETEIIK
jgi:hypothetical protein